MSDIKPVAFGCHCDLEEGMEPDGCVLDDSRPQDCIYAKRLWREGKYKTDCEYWRPIKRTEDVQVYYTSADLRQARKDALEEAAKVCEEYDPYQNTTYYGTVPKQCAAAIRALKEEK